MPTTRQPRAGSLQYRPRRRADTEVARVRSWAKPAEARLLGFAGYKVGMTHTLMIDDRAGALTKGEEIFAPVTIIECPPIKALSAVFYRSTPYGLKKVTEVATDKFDKELSRIIPIPKKSKRKIDDIKPEEYDDARLVVHTQPKLTRIGKKKPEIFEVGIGGNKDAKLKFIKENLGKEIKVSDVFASGMMVNIHSVTRGKGTQGPVRRDGIALKSHKAEKSRRRGVLESEGLRKVTYRVHQQGKMGYNPRTEYNRWIMKIGEEGKEIASKAGFRHYGIVKNNYILIKGSVGGPAKRLIRLSYATRVQNVMRKAPTIPFVSLR